MLRIEGSTKYLILEGHDCMEQAVHSVIEMERSNYFLQYIHKENVIMYLKSIYITDAKEKQIDQIMTAAQRMMNSPIDYPKYESLINRIASSTSGTYHPHHQLTSEFDREWEALVKSILK